MPISPRVPLWEGADQTVDHTLDMLGVQEGRSRPGTVKVAWLTGSSRAPGSDLAPRSSPWAVCVSISPPSRRVFLPRQSCGE